MHTDVRTAMMIDGRYGVTRGMWFRPPQGADICTATRFSVFRPSPTYSTPRSTEQQKEKHRGHALNYGCSTTSREGRLWNSTESTTPMYRKPNGTRPRIRNVLRAVRGVNLNVVITWSRIFAYLSMCTFFCLIHTFFW